MIAAATNNSIDNDNKENSPTKSLARHILQCVKAPSSENSKAVMNKFWNSHSLSNLRMAMDFANNKQGGPHCACTICKMGREKRSRQFRLNRNVGFLVDENPYDKYDENEYECEFAPYFCSLLEKNNISIVYTTSEHHSYEYKFAGFMVLDVECHLAVSGKDPGFSLLYMGSKLANATTKDDPSIESFANLFLDLYSEEFEICDDDDDDSDDDNASAIIVDAHN